MTPGFQIPNPDGWLVRTKDGENFVEQERFHFVRKNGQELFTRLRSKTDGPSIPFAAQFFIRKNGLIWPCGVLHDGGYQNALEDVNGNPIVLTRAECDDLILEAMELQGIDFLERKTVYDQLRLWGWKAFNEDRKEQCKPQLTL